MSAANVISLLGGVALFLFGMSLMGEGLTRVAGNKLEMILYRLSSTTVRGVLLGTVVTAVIQSSSATSVMVVGFVNSGMMNLAQAISVILGSQIGTSITGWIICLSAIGDGASGLASLLSTATLTGIIAVVGIIMRLFCKSMTKRHVGEILLGFSVLMYGISAMGSAVAPLKDSPAFIGFITRFSNPVLGLIMGIVITTILQSASSAVGLLQTLAITGVIDFSIAFPIILGISIGASFPVLLSAYGAKADAKRSAWSYLLMNVLGAVLAGVAFYGLNALFDFAITGRLMTSVSIAALNTIYRIFSVVLLAPFSKQMSDILCRMIRDDKNPEKVIMQPLEERFLSIPTVALANCLDAVTEMAYTARDNIRQAVALLDDYSEDGYNQVQETENLVDTYEDRLGTYLVSLSSQEMTKRQSQDTAKFLHVIGDLERLSDHAVNISEAAKEISDRSIVFSDAAKKELKVVRDAVFTVIDTAIEGFLTEDIPACRSVEPLEELIDNLCDRLKRRHIERIQSGACSLNNGFVFNDLITNFERVSDHCSNIAIATLEIDTGAFDMHGYIAGIKKGENTLFEMSYDEYAKRFKLPEKQKAEG